MLHVYNIPILITLENGKRLHKSSMESWKSCNQENENIGSCHGGKCPRSLCGSSNHTAASCRMWPVAVLRLMAKSTSGATGLVFMSFSLIHLFFTFLKLLKWAPQSEIFLLFPGTWRDTELVVELWSLFLRGLCKGTHGGWAVTFRANWVDLVNALGIYGLLHQCLFVLIMKNDASIY